MTRKKPGAKPRKPVVRRKGGQSPNMVNQQAEAVMKALDAMGPTTTQFERMFILDKPTLWQRICSWCRDNPIDAVLVAVGLGGALVLGVLAAL
jgi:hypothetical protein